VTVFMYGNEQAQRHKKSKQSQHGAILAVLRDIRRPGVR
jgi:hypothetical protein